MKGPCCGRFSNPWKRHRVVAKVKRRYSTSTWTMVVCTWTLRKSRAITSSPKKPKVFCFFFSKKKRFLCPSKPKFPQQHPSRRTKRLRHTKEPINIGRMVNIHTNPRQFQNGRLDANGACGGEMWVVAILPKPQRDQQRRHAKHGVGPELVMRGNDGESWGRIGRRQQGFDFPCCHQRNITGQGEDTCCGREGAPGGIHRAGMAITGAIANQTTANTAAMTPAVAGRGA